MSENGKMSNLSFRGMAMLLRLRERSLDARQRLLDAGVGPGQVVLDYGCGIGSYSLPAAQIVGAGGKVYALDIHPLAVEAVERRAGKENLSNIQTILSSRDSGLAGDSVDVVLLYDVLHSVPDRPALLQELHRVLKPGGRLSVLPDHMGGDELLATMNGGDLFDLEARHGEVFAFRKTATQGVA
jgi:ubiquinone/menaquinone biosynthesis C-methylase UbiE